MRTPFTGCGTALVTPFTAGGSVDEAGVRRLGRRQIDAGVVAPIERYGLERMKDDRSQARQLQFLKTLSRPELRLLQTT